MRPHENHSNTILTNPQIIGGVLLIVGYLVVSVYLARKLANYMNSRGRNGTLWAISLVIIPVPTLIFFYIFSLFYSGEKTQAAPVKVVVEKKEVVNEQPVVVEKVVVKEEPVVEEQIKEKHIVEEYFKLGLYCTLCGYKNYEGSNFCHSCGKKFDS